MYNFKIHEVMKTVKFIMGIAAMALTTTAMAQATYTDKDGN